MTLLSESIKQIVFDFYIRQQCDSWNKAAFLPKCKEGDRYFFYLILVEAAFQSYAHIIARGGERSNQMIVTVGAEATKN
jgi:hypothetical protein